MERPGKVQKKESIKQQLKEQSHDMALDCIMNQGGWFKNRSMENNQENISKPSVRCAFKLIM